MTLNTIEITLDWYRTLKRTKFNKIILTTYKNGKASKPVNCV